MTRPRRLHRAAGLLLTLPLLAWALTGALFFVKPGWGPAYAPLAVKTYPLGAGAAPAPDPDWLEVRLVRTVLGVHVLARTSAGWKNQSPPPGPEARKRLLEDAIGAERARYGQLLDPSDDPVRTTSGARLTLDWDRLSLYQRGVDTDRIDLLYKIHYLQWTGHTTLDRVLGILGLALLLALTAMGLFLAFPGTFSSARRPKP